MGKQQSPLKKAEAVNLGKGKVTPVQIAFIVDRYLADSGYAATLDSFRSEAAELFSKTKNREVPKNLLSLAKILDDYVTLKEQRLVVDQEKQRVEALLRGIHEAVHAYRSSGGDAAAGPSLPSTALPSPSLPIPSPPPPALVASKPMSPAIATSNSSSRSPPGPMVHNIPVLASPSSLVPSNIAHPGTFSTPIAEASCSNKRKNAKPALKAPAAPKKFRGRSQTEASTSEGIPPPSQSHDTKGGEETIQRLPSDHLACISHQNPCSSVPGSSVAKSLFKHLPDRKASSTSPKTPPKASTQADKMASPIESLSVSHNLGADTCKLPTPSKRSVISSRIVVVSPLKNKGYYAVEKSYCISSSPIKSNLIRQGQRDNVKGRLDFDDTDVPICSAKSPAAATETSTSSTDDAIEDIFDLDLPDLDIDFSFSELLVNIDLDGQEFGKSYHLASKPSADFIT
ncbi:hypothetical protein Taro_045077, partial [Colocasia esculenta]|nr:hypothetical protein [Colocasia esculenta]